MQQATKQAHKTVNFACLVFVRVVDKGLEMLTFLWEEMILIGQFFGAGSLGVKQSPLLIAI